MQQILQKLDAEWPVLATSPEARRAVIRWKNEHDALTGMSDLHDVLACRHDARVANDVHQFLAHRAAGDPLATRTLLQILLPGVVRLVATVGYDDLDAPDELVAIAWERIATYPATRNGSVAANVILDVRKRYLKLRSADIPSDVDLCHERHSQASLPEDQVIAALQLEEIADAHRRGLVSETAFEAIIRTRVEGEPLATVAADQGFTPEVMCQRRWRAEQRLRSLPLAG